MKVGKWFEKRGEPVILEDDILVTDEWYQYYRKCTNNLKKILEILDSKTFNQNFDEIFSNSRLDAQLTKFWDCIIDIRFLAEIKNPEAMKEWLSYCRSIEKKPLVSKTKNGKIQTWNERKKVLYSWLKRAKAVGITPLPPNRPSSGKRKEWEESIIKAEKQPKPKKGKYPPYNSVKDGAYKWECIDKLKYIKPGSFLIVEDRIYQTVDWWIRAMENTMEEFKGKLFHAEEINHNTQKIWRVK